MFTPLGAFFRANQEATRLFYSSYSSLTMRRAVTLPHFVSQFSELDYVRNVANPSRCRLRCSPPLLRRTEFKSNSIALGHRAKHTKCRKQNVMPAMSSIEDDRVMESGVRDPYNPAAAVIKQSAQPTGTPLPHLREFPMNPRVSAERIVQHGNVRVQILSKRLIRVEFSADSVFEDRASFTFPLRGSDASKISFEARHDDSILTVKTPLVLLQIPTYGEELDDDSLVVTALTGKRKFREHRFRKSDKFTSGTHLLDGTCRTLDEADGFYRRDWKTNKAWRHVDLSNAILSRAGVVFIDDSQCALFSDDGWFAPRRHPNPGRKYADVYILISNPLPKSVHEQQDYRAALRAFSAASGKSPLLPRRFLGNWWSRYYAYTEKSLKDLLLNFESRCIPLSVMIIDMDWHLVKEAREISGQKCDGWTGYTWNKKLFPNPPAFIQWLHDRNLSTALNLHPADGVWRHEAMYQMYAEFLGARDMARRGEPIPFDLSTELSAAAYFQVLLHPHEDMGDYEKSFWWIDWQQGSRSRIEGVDPLFQLNHLHYLDLGRNNGKRSAIFSRFAGLGSHRYPVGFSGDTWSTWESLAYQPYMSATSANANYFYWSHDIGGHTRQIPGGDELYARWVQFGCLSAIMRLHSSNNPYIFRNPWAYNAEACQVASSAMRKRHEMIPYIYSCLYQSHVADVPLLMPMYYTDPEEEAAYAVPGQYWFGSELIAAPIVLPRDKSSNLAQQVIWLPGSLDGVSCSAPWRHLETGEAVEADAFHALYGGLDYVPLFAKPGAIIPQAPPSSGSGAALHSVQNPSTIHVTVIAGSNGQFSLYEDEENGRRRQFLTDINFAWNENHCAIDVSAPRSTLTGKANSGSIEKQDSIDVQGVLPLERTWCISIMGIKKEVDIKFQSESEGQVSIPMEYDEMRETAVICVPNVPVMEPLRVMVFDLLNSGLLSARDRRLEKVKSMIQGFHLGSEKILHLSQVAEKLLSDISILSSINNSEIEIEDRMGSNWTVTPEMKRALYEIIVGSGCSRAYLSRPGAPAIAWRRSGDESMRLTVGVEEVNIPKEKGYIVFWPQEGGTASQALNEEVRCLSADSEIQATFKDIFSVTVPLADVKDNAPWPAPLVRAT